MILVISKEAQKPKVSIVVEQAFDMLAWKEKRGMDRRDFIKGMTLAGVVATGAGVVGCAPTAPQSGESNTEGKLASASAIEPVEVIDTDIAVVGAGVSGLSAAIEAREQGVEVVVLEKQPQCGGNGVIVECVFAKDSKLQKEMGIEFPLSQVLAGEQDMARYLGDITAWRNLASQSAANIDWLMSHGVKFATVDDYSGFSHVACAHEFEGGGAAAMETLAAAAKDAGAQFMMETSGDQLIIDEEGNVTGVYALNKAGEYLQINAKAVLLATGGFQGNPEMMAERGYPEDNCFDEGMPGHTGDGLRMAIAAGGADVSMKRTHITAQSLRDWPVSGKKVFSLADPGDYVWVNQDGLRFANESCGLECPVYPPNAIFSQERSYSLFDNDFLERYDAVQDVADAVAGDSVGDKFTADTLDELAEMAGIDPIALKSTVEHYNECCAKGEDDEFGKSADLMFPIQTPPYYLLHKIVRFMCTIGGIHTNNHMQVIDMARKPISGLYAIGVDGCELYVTAYTLGIAGSANANNVYSGRVAVQHAVENCL